MTIQDLHNQRIGIIGFGEEGQAVARYLGKHSLRPIIFDKKEQTTLAPDAQTYSRS